MSLDHPTRETAHRRAGSSPASTSLPCGRAWLAGHGIHARPPGSTESQLEGLTRMAAVLRDVLALPGRPLVIGHGLLVSVLAHVTAGGPAAALVFPEAGYLAPVAFTAADLAALHRGLADAPEGRPGRGRSPEPEKPARVVTVEGDRRRNVLPP